MTTIVNPEIRFADGIFNEAILSSTTSIPYSKLTQRTTAVHGVPLTSCRVHDAPQTNLGTSPGAGVTDDLGISGSGSTEGMHLTTGDQKTQGSLTFYAWFETHLPPNYDDGETVQVEFEAGMLTTVADTSCTVDCEVYGISGSTGVAVDGLDLCTTAAQSINSLTMTNAKFDVSAASLTAGQRLSIRIIVIINDGASGTAVEGVIRDISLLCDTKG